jgi:acetyl-CoA carboxylase carboxyl transferase subunit beta
LKDELVTIVRMLTKQSAPIKGDLPMPEAEPAPTPETTSK